MFLAICQNTVMSKQPCWYNLDWKTQFMCETWTINYRHLQSFGQISLINHEDLNKVYVSFFEAKNFNRIFFLCYIITMLKTKLHDVFYIYLIVCHGAEFMYVRMQLAFSYTRTVLLCLPSKKRETVTFYISVYIRRLSLHRCTSRSITFTDR